MNDQTPLRRAAGRTPEADLPREERKRQWQEENAAAIESSNAWVRKHGLPLAKYRQF